MPKTDTFPFFGSVSTATMRSKDLLPTFSDVLRTLDVNGKYTSLLYDAATCLDALIEGNESAPILEHEYEIVNDLMDALCNYAPNGYYFGSHPGDGADYGFWQVEDEDSEP